MLRSASEGGRSLTPSVRSGHQIPVHGTGPYSLVDNGEVTDPLLQETLEQENERTPHTDDDLAWLAELPWYRRPHPAWLYPLILIFSMAGGILLAPRMEMYLSLICDDLGLAPAPGSSGRAHIPSQECRQSPMAQRQLSMLQLVLLLTNGIGSAFTSGFWSRLSDRKGRNAIMMVNVLGIFAMDVVVLIVSRNTLHELPMGSYFLAIGTMIEGCLGGYSAVNAMSLCYISDVTRSGTRARLFAVTTGVMFSGVAIGPSVGGHLTAATGDVVITLWISAMLHAVIILVLPFFPESLNQVRRDEATRAHKETQANAPHASAWERLYKAALAPFRSLRILMPERICDEYSQLPEDPDVPPSNVQLSLPHVFGSCTCDINMLLVSLAYFLESMTIAIVPVKIQYVQLVFNWSSEMLGLFMSYTALSRMLMLVAVLPLLIPLVHRPLASIVLPQDAAGAAPDAGPTSLDAEGRARAPPPPSAEPEASNSRSAAEHRLEQQWVQRAKILRLMHDTRMDRRLAVGSALLTSVAAILTGVAQSAWLFLFAVLLTAVGSGIGSAVNSLALALLWNPNEAGRLFGAWAVLGTVSSSIVGPFLFTYTFSLSAATAPSLVFYVIAGVQGLAALAVLALKLRAPASLAGLPPRPPLVT